MTILIPAYEPTPKMLLLIKQLKEQSEASIILVDDGSGAAYQPLFKTAQAMGCTVLHHQQNQGKGAALKTGFIWLSGHNDGEGAVCADCDGQHAAADILKIADAVRNNSGRVIIGSRQFAGKVPIRSRFGNTVTRLVFASATRQTVRDTQSGLRGYSADMLPWLCSIEGNRFEYEIRVLLEAQNAGYSIMEIPIETIYEQHHSSHFRTIADSVIVYLPILKFSASSLLASALDFGLLLSMKAVTENLFVSVVSARIVSATFNYLFNRHLVFKPGQNGSYYALKYFSLVVAIMLCNYGLLALLTQGLTISLVPAKIITECILFSISYWMQKNVVFRETIQKRKDAER